MSLSFRCASPLRIQLLVLVLSLSTSPALLAQTLQQAGGTSPSNAGQNSGNNTSGSSGSPISTPSFNPPTLVPAVTGVSVSPTGVVTAPPAVVNAVNIAVSTDVSSGNASILAPVTSAAVAPAALSGPQAIIPDVSVGVSGGSQQIVPLVGVATQTAQLVSVGALITVIRTSTNTSGTISVSEGSLLITTGGASVEVPATPANRVAIAQFASVAIAAGFAPPAISLGAQLVGLGAPTPQVLQLMASLQGLANQSTLTSLSTGITSFNTIVETASPATLSALATNPVFTAARSTLSAARSALSSAI